VDKDRLKADYDVMIKADRKHLDREINEGQVHNAGRRAKSLARLIQDRKALGE
jgi:hypothetical protein